MQQSRRNFLKLLALGCPAAYVAAKAGPLLMAPEALPVQAAVATGSISTVDFCALLKAAYGDMLRAQIAETNYLISQDTLLLPSKHNFQGGIVFVPFS